MCGHSLIIIPPRDNLHAIKCDIPGPCCPHLLPIHICRQSIIKVKALVPRSSRIALLEPGFRRSPMA